MPKVSIIVPIYNTEQYLEECIDSILSQTYSNIELLLVDDGSTDSSPAICDRYAEKDSRVTVIHQKNGGRSLARNTGLDNATGEFILFVDSDDYIDRTTVEELINAQSATGADMVIFNFYGKLHKPFPWGNDMCSGEEAVERVFRHIAYISPCTRLCHRSIYDNIRFPAGLNFEDTYKSADIMMAASRIYNYDKSLYFYREVETGITSSAINAKHMDAFYAYENLYYFVKEKNFTECIPMARQELLYFFVSIYGAFLPSDEAGKKRKAEIKEKFLSMRRELWQNETVVNKISILLLSISPYMAHNIFKMYRYLVKEVLKK